jgi:hypothetical protein
LQGEAFEIGPITARDHYQDQRDERQHYHAHRAAHPDQRRQDQGHGERKQRRSPAPPAARCENEQRSDQRRPQWTGGGNESAL